MFSFPTFCTIEIPCNWTNYFSNVHLLNKKRPTLTSHPSLTIILCVVLPEAVRYIYRNTQNKYLQHTRNINYHANPCPAAGIELLRLNWVGSSAKPSRSLKFTHIRNSIHISRFFYLYNGQPCCPVSMNIVYLRSPVHVITPWRDVSRDCKNTCSLNKSINLYLLPLSTLVNNNTWSQRKADQTAEVFYTLYKFKASISRYRQCCTCFDTFNKQQLSRLSPWMKE